jgi:hypothetical protein
MTEVTKNLHKMAESEKTETQDRSAKVDFAICDVMHTTNLQISECPLYCCGKQGS